MRFEPKTDLESLASALPRFVDLVGAKRWWKRADQLGIDQRSSPYMWKIVADYHWLEMALSHHSDVLGKEGRLNSNLITPEDLAALCFASDVVEVHSRLPRTAQARLEGSLRDALNAESGFSALYLEIDMAMKLMAEKYDVTFTDLEASASFDMVFSRGAFSGEVECKSISVDAGRPIHRKDFCRFIDRLTQRLGAEIAFGRHEVLIVTLENRLSAALSDQDDLAGDASTLLEPGGPSTLNRSSYCIERRPAADFPEILSTLDASSLRDACRRVFGGNAHVAGGLSDTGGCLFVVASRREDDTSKPWLEAMRYAASQLSQKRPGFIAVQFQDLAASDLMSPHLRRRAGLLSLALFSHYGARHVNATYTCGYGAVVHRNNQLGAPAFAVPKPDPAFALSPAAASPFLVSLTDEEYAEALGSPLPQANISKIKF
jgi:hypothetical protein